MGDEIVRSLHGRWPSTPRFGIEVMWGKPEERRRSMKIYQVQALLFSSLLSIECGGMHVHEYNRAHVCDFTADRFFVVVGMSVS